MKSSEHEYKSIRQYVVLYLEKLHPKGIFHDYVPLNNHIKLAID